MALLSFMAAATALALGAYRGRRDVALRFDPNPASLPESLTEAGEVDLRIVVVNHTERPVRIVGVLEKCTNVCYYGRGLPMSVPAGGRAPLTLHVKAGLTGRVSDFVTFFTDCPEQPRLNLEVRGAVPPLESPEDAPGDSTDR